MRKYKSHIIIFGPFGLFTTATTTKKKEKKEKKTWDNSVAIQELSPFQFSAPTRMKLEPAT